MMGLQARVQALIDEPQSLAEVVTRINRITCANCPPTASSLLFAFWTATPANSPTATRDTIRPSSSAPTDRHEQLPEGGPGGRYSSHYRVSGIQRQMGKGDILAFTAMASRKPPTPPTKSSRSRTGRRCRTPSQRSRDHDQFRNQQSPYILTAGTPQPTTSR